MSLNQEEILRKESYQEQPYLQERLVELKQQEVQREVEQARLLKEAGLSNQGWLAR